MSPDDPGSAAGADGLDVVIRPLDGLAEREACVALQEEVWGEAFSDRVPASVLMIAGETGGVASGAFNGDRLVGFVFGITGVRAGRPIHWSDMLAVAPEYRGRGIGFRLKVHQRALLLGRGVETVLWTFDPLEAANAHLNLNRLGATAGQYLRDAYGASDSPLHAGIGTDRWLVEWAIGSERVAGRLDRQEDGGPSGDGLPVLNPAATTEPQPCAGTMVRSPSGLGAGPVDGAPDRVAVVIPRHIQRLKDADSAAAVAWRANVRTALEGALAEGYTAVALDRDPVGDGGVVRYVLERGFSL